MDKEKIICILMGIISCLFAALFLQLSTCLPEWMLGMMLVGGIVLLYCLQKIL